MNSIRKIKNSQNALRIINNIFLCLNDGIFMGNKSEIISEGKQYLKDLSQEINNQIQAYDKEISASIEKVESKAESKVVSLPMSPPIISPESPL